MIEEVKIARLLYYIRTCSYKNPTGIDWEKCKDKDKWLKNAREICRHFPRSPDNPDGYEPKLSPSVISKIRQGLKEISEGRIVPLNQLEPKPEMHPVSMPKRYGQHRREDPVIRGNNKPKPDEGGKLIECAYEDWDDTVLPHPICHCLKREGIDCANVPNDVVQCPDFVPKPGRLLTDMKVIIDERTKNCVDANYNSVRENLEWLVTKTASIIRAEFTKEKALIFNPDWTPDIQAMLKEFNESVVQIREECKDRMEGIESDITKVFREADLRFLITEGDHEKFRTFLIEGVGQALKEGVK